MTVRLIVVGGVKGALAKVIRDYEERCRHYWKLEVVEVSAGASRSRAEADAVQAAEGERILARLPQGETVVLLSREGRGMGSRELSEWLQEQALRGSRGVNFVVGGAYGVSPAVEDRAERALSISAMTFPHEVARLLLVEQLYRAGSILRGEPYHKGP